MASPPSHSRVCVVCVCVHMCVHMCLNIGIGLVIYLGFFSLRVFLSVSFSPQCGECFHCSHGLGSLLATISTVITLVGLEESPLPQLFILLYPA